MAEIPPKYEKAFANVMLAVAIILGCVFVAPKVMLLFMPFIIGSFFALLMNPLVEFMEKKLKLNRKIATVFIIVAVVLGSCFLLCLLGSFAVKEIRSLMTVMPRVWQDIEMEEVEAEISSVVGEMTVPMADALGDFAGNLPAVLLAVVMCLLSSYFFVAEKDRVFCFLKKIIPVSWNKKCILLKKATVDVVMGYLKAQFKIELWIYLIVVAGFVLLKVRYGWVIAFFIAFLDMLPVFGTGIVLIPWAVFVLLSGDYKYALGLLVIWGIGQLVRQMIQPKMMGDAMGMGFMPTLILLYIGYKFAGVVGMLAAVPLGILVLTMNKLGFFDNCKNSIRILSQGFQEFRQFTEDEE